MATIGLRINQGGQLDTRLADTFVKALMGDPETEAKIAQMMTERETERYRQRLLLEQATTEETQRRTLAAQGGLYASQAAHAEAVRQSELAQQRGGQDWAAARGALAEQEMPVPVQTQFEHEGQRPTSQFVGPMPTVVDMDAFARAKALRDAKLNEAKAAAVAVGSSFTDSNASEIAQGQGELSGRLALEQSLAAGKPPDPNAALLYRVAPPSAGDGGNLQIWTDNATGKSYEVHKDATGKGIYVPINDPGNFGAGSETERAKSRIARLVQAARQGAVVTPDEKVQFQGDIENAWPRVKVTKTDRYGAAHDVYIRLNAPQEVTDLETRLTGATAEAPAPQQAAAAEASTAGGSDVAATAVQSAAAQPAAAAAPASTPAPGVAGAVGATVASPPGTEAAAQQPNPASTPATATVDAAAAGSPGGDPTADPDNVNAIVAARQAFLAQEKAGTVSRGPGFVDIVTKEPEAIKATEVSQKAFASYQKIRDSVAYMNKLSKVSPEIAKELIPPFALKLVQDPANPALVVIAGKAALPPKYNEYVHHVEVLVNAILRDETGAAAAFGEKPGAEMRFAMQFNDSPQDRRMKMNSLWNYLHATRLAINRSIDPQDLLDADSQYKSVGLNIDMPNLEQADRTPGAAPAGAGPLTTEIDLSNMPKPADIPQDRWDLLKKHPDLLRAYIEAGQRPGTSNGNNP